MTATHGQHGQTHAPGVHVASGAVLSSHDLEVAHQVDTWHHHEAVEEGEPQGEHLSNIDPLLVGKWFLIFGVVVAATIAALWVYFDHYVANLKRERQEISLAAEYQAQKEKDEAVLGFASAAAGSREASFQGISGRKVQLPIDLAMEKVIESSAKQTRTLVPALGQPAASIPPAPPPK